MLKRPSRLIAEIICSLAVVSMAGCATPFDRLRDYRGADSGRLVLSLGVPDEGYHEYTPLLSGRRVGTDDVLELTYARAADGRILVDIPFMTGAGQVVVRSLPPSDYEIDKSYMLMGRIEDDVGRLAGDGLDPIRFTIRTGQTTYLGSYAVRMSSVEPDTYIGEAKVTYISSMRMQVGISDEQERDIANARIGHAEMTADTIVNMVPQQKKIVF